MTVALATQMFAGIGSALALIVPVDFSSVTNTTDITLPNSLAFNGISFTFDNGGVNPDPTFGNPNTAFIDTNGITGNAYGTLIFNFSQMAFKLNVDYALLNGTPLPLPVTDGLTVLFSSGGNIVDNLTIPASFYNGNGDAAGQLVYSAAPSVYFDQAQLIFSADAPYFNVSAVSAEIVPEPSSYALAIVGIGVIACGRFVRRRLPSSK